MIVLEIIGGLLVLFLLYGATLEIDKYSQKVYAYEFFTTDNLVIAIIGYALLSLVPPLLRWNAYIILIYQNLSIFTKHSISQLTSKLLIFYS